MRGGTVKDSTVNCLPPARKGGRGHATARRWMAVPALAALTVGMMGMGPLPGAQAAGAQGCNYGQTGPKAEALCWIDMSSLDFAQASSAGGQSMSLNLPGGSIISFTVKIEKNVPGAQPVLSNDDAGTLNYANEHGPRTLVAHAYPTYTGAVIGNAYYTQTAGKPALWTTLDRIENPDGSTSDWSGWVDHVELSNITVTKNGVPYPEYSLIMADAESTDATGPEALAFTSDKPIQPLFTAQPDGYSAACAGGLSGVGRTTQAICSGGNDGSAKAGAAVMKATAPSTVAIDMRVAFNSREAVAFAVMFTQASGSVTVNNANGQATGTHTMTVQQGDIALGQATTDGSARNTGVIPKQPIVAGEGTVISYALNHGGGTPDGAYDVTWVCTVNGAPATPQLSNSGRNASVKAEPDDAVNCDAHLTARGPQTGDASTTIEPDQVATLTPDVTPGKGAVTSAAFDNGQTTKVVPGEGSWSITVVEGKPVATFTPEPGYHGAVTSQKYTVTDVNGLTSNLGTLAVTIKVPVPPSPTPTPTPTPTQPPSPSPTPTLPPSPTKPSDPSPSTNPGGSPENPENPSGRLPMTGADNVAGLAAGSLVLMGAGGAAIMYARRRRGQ